MQTGFNTNDLSKAAQNSSKAVAGATAKVIDQTEDLGSRVSQFKDQVVNAVSEDFNAASKMTRDAVRQLPNAVKYIEAAVRKHPFTAAGIALGFGAVAVKLLSNRPSKHI